MFQGKKTRGRQRIEIKRIENEDDRMITFSKRRSGIYKKASELATLCGAEVGIVVFSPAGKPFSYGHPSIEAIMNRYFNLNPPPNDNTHPLVEAQRRLKAHELSQQLNDIEEKLDEEKERAKELKILKDGNQGQGGWWDIAIEELEMEDVEKLKGLMGNFYKRLADRAKELVNGASSSGANALAPIQAQFTLPMNYGGAHGEVIMNNNNVFDDQNMVKPYMAQLNNMALLPPPPPPPCNHFGNNFY